MDIRVKTLVLEGNCPECHQNQVRSITFEQYCDLQEGDKFIQDIFPKNTPAFREFFMSGICPECWVKLMTEE